MWKFSDKAFGIFRYLFLLRRYGIFLLSVFFNSVRIIYEQYLSFLQCKAKPRPPPQKKMLELFWYLLTFFRDMYIKEKDLIFMFCYAPYSELIKNLTLQKGEAAKLD